MRAVNLLPRDDIRQRREGASLQARILVAVPIVAVVLIGAGWLVTGGKVKNDRSTLSALQAELAAIPPPKTTPQIPALAAQHEQRVTALAGVLSGRLAWDRILRHISSVLPGDVWLTKLIAVSTQPTPTVPIATAPATTTTATTSTTTTTPATPVVTPTIPSVTSLEIDGYTYSQEGVARFLARLSVVPDLTGVTLKSSTLSPIGNRNVVSFAITATVQPPGATS